MNQQYTLSEPQFDEDFCLHLECTRDVYDCVNDELTDLCDVYRADGDGCYFVVLNTRTDVAKYRAEVVERIERFLKENEAIA